MSLDATLLGVPGFSGDPYAQTLFNAAKMSNSPVVQAIVKSIYSTGNAAADIPWRTSKALRQVGKRYTGKSMPRVDYLPLNTDPIGINADPEDFEEFAYRVLNSMDIDVAIAEDPNLVANAIASKWELYKDTLRAKFNDYLINNNHTTGDVYAPIGLKARLADVKYEVPSDLITSLNVDISTSSTTLAASANAFLLGVDNMLSAMSNTEGDDVVIYGSSLGKNSISYAARALNQGGGLRTDKDNYDRVIEKYRNANVKDLGRKVDQSTSIVSNSEDVNGNIVGGGKYTSLYFVRMGAPYFTGWQTGMPNIYDVGRLPNGVTNRKVFRWEYGFYVENTRAIGRLVGIKVQAG